jgi:hypothetical protein
VDDSTAVVHSYEVDEIDFEAELAGQITTQSAPDSVHVSAVLGDWRAEADLDRCDSPDLVARVLAGLTDSGLLGVGDVD